MADFPINVTGVYYRREAPEADARTMTFAEWYESQIGVPLDQAKRAGVYDLELLEKAFNFLPTAAPSFPPPS